MKEKSHARSPDKRNFSIALPNVLIDALQKIAKKETRSRNAQIEHFLDRAVRDYLKANAKIQLEPKDMMPKDTSIHSLPSPPRSEKRKTR